MGGVERLISYAQNREDIILYAFFKNRSKPGFYVDVGAYRPDDHSVTKFFYERGWRGINIEPNEALIKLFNDSRPEDINLNIGVASKPGKLKLRKYDAEGLSTFSDKMQSQYGTNPLPGTEKYVEIEVQVNTLKDTLLSHKVKEIQFLKIDVEGFEYEVLEGNDWTMFRPQVICIEANHIYKDWSGLLKKHGYILAFFDGLNEYYVADECPELLNNFSYADTALVEGQVVDAQQEIEIANAKDNREKDNRESQQRIQHYEKEIARQQFKIAELDASIQHLEVELNRQKSIKSQTKTLYRSLDDKIMRAIDSRGYKRGDKNKTSKIQPLNIANINTKDLQNELRVYDVNAYFRYHSKPESMKIQYRIAGKMYRTTRGMVTHSARHGYRLVSKARRGQ